MAGTSHFRQQQHGLLWRLAAAEQQQQQKRADGAAGDRRRALFFSNKTLPAAFPSTPSPPPALRYNPCSAAHAAAYLNREASKEVINGRVCVAQTSGGVKPSFEHTEHMFARTHDTTTNEQDVKAAIHADAAITWRDCSTHVLDRFERSDWVQTMEPTYKWLVYVRTRLVTFLSSPQHSTI